MLMVRGARGGRWLKANAMKFRSRARHGVELVHIFFYGCAVLALLVHCSDFVSAQPGSVPAEFHLLSLSAQQLTCSGSSSLTPTSPGAACLVPPAANSTAIVGRCFYTTPISFSNITGASFSTMFSFTTLTFPEAGDAGQGFTFYIGPDDSSTGAAFGYLGWINSISDGNKSGNNFAVEFDLAQNSTFNDPPYQHVGINVNSITSIDFVQFNDLTSQSSIQKLYAWIEYDGQKKTIEVRLSKGPNKPCRVLLSTNLTLTDVLLDTMYVGFSSSGGNISNAQTTIWDWSFSAGGKAKNIFSQDARCGPLSPMANVALVAAAIVFIMLVLLFLGLVFVLDGRTRKISGLESEKNKLVDELKHLNFGAREFSYQDMVEATDGFNRQVGIGGFGTVFKGDLSNIRSSKYSKDDEKIVAVKKIKRTSQSVEDAKQLVAEVKVIGRLRHNNIVPLLGWCYDRGEMLLVYKYMENGDVDMHLFPSDYGSPVLDVLSWDKRMKTLRGVAAALVFLHDEFEFFKSVVHSDIKTRNVMVDHNFNARLGDFGLARLYDPNRKARLYSEVLMGTKGYIAPEYLEMGATVKTDVYSFGVLALVVATGRKPIDMSIPEGLVKWVRHMYDDGTIAHSKDGQLQNDKTFNLEEMERVLKVGLFCCSYEPEVRPCMSEVLTALKGIPSILSAALPLQIPKQVSSSNFDFLEEVDDSSQITSTSNYLSRQGVSRYLANLLSNRKIDVDR